MNPSSETQTISDLRARHYDFGWRMLLLFLTMGLVLELLHGLKIDWYLSVASSTRRHMWTLAHSHGALLGLINLAFGAFLGWHSEQRGKISPWASHLLIAATLLIPAGFFFGGIGAYSGDPSLAIALTPIGGLMLLVAVFLCSGFGPKRKP